MLTRINNDSGRTLCNCLTKEKKKKGNPNGVNLMCKRLLVTQKNIFTKKFKKKKKKSCCGCLDIGLFFTISIDLGWGMHKLNQVHTDTRWSGWKRRRINRRESLFWEKTAHGNFYDSIQLSIMNVWTKFLGTPPNSCCGFTKNHKC